ncbi:MAG: hypothetical protein R3B13_09500 [Polyangiaceae bacterium]
MSRPDGASVGAQRREYLHVDRSSEVEHDAPRRRHGALRELGCDARQLPIAHCKKHDVGRRRACGQAAAQRTKLRRYAPLAQHGVQAAPGAPRAEDPDSHA